LDIPCSIFKISFDETGGLTIHHSPGLESDGERRPTGPVQRDRSAQLLRQGTHQLQAQRFGSVNIQILR
jgi:hypothetical protein